MRETLYLINVGVPHLGEEAEGRWGVWVVYGELDPSLGHNNSSSHHYNTHILLRDWIVIYKIFF